LAAAPQPQMRQDSAMAKGARGKPGVDAEIGRLFELPPEEFTGARDASAKRLASEGRSEEARSIKALRRPTVAAWAVNQLARRRPAEIEELLKAGTSLQRAQRKVLSGVRSSDFREASEERRRVVNQLVRLAEEVLEEAGRSSAAASEAVRSTLEAASLDDGSAELVREGRLSKELPAPASFGAVEGLGLVPAQPEEEPAPARGRARRGAEKEKEESRALRARQAEAGKEAKELADKAAQARRAAIKAREVADRAEARVERLRSEAEEARIKARDATRDAQQAETQARRAQDAADRAAQRLERLETEK
jgi:hypothetical protein